MKYVAPPIETLLCVRAVLCFSQLFAADQGDCSVLYILQTGSSEIFVIYDIFVLQNN